MACPSANNFVASPGSVASRVLLDVLAAVVLAAAGLKAYDVLIGVDRRPATTGVVAFVEATVAAGLVLYRSPRTRRRLALGRLAVFAAVSGWHWIAGAESCGCFGRQLVPPSWTFGFDAAMAILLVIVGGPSPMIPVRRDYPTRHHLARWCAVSVLAVAVAVGVKATTGHAAGDLAKVVMVDPALRPGQPFPLLDYLDPAGRADLVHGDRTVVLYRAGCEHCKAYIQSLDPRRSPGLRFVEVPYAGLTANANTPPIVSAPLLLRPDTTYAVTVPTRVSLQDGMVRRVVVVGGAFPDAAPL